EQDAHVDLVALGLEPVEETLDAIEVPAAADQDLALVGREPRHRNVGTDRVAPAGAEEVVVGGFVGRRVPRSDRPLRERERTGRNRLLQTHADHAPEALAGRTRAERRVEGEERRRRIPELAAAVRTVQPAPERAGPLFHSSLEAAGQREGGLRGGGELGPRG